MKVDIGWTYKLGCLIDQERGGGGRGHGSLRSVDGKKGEGSEIHLTEKIYVALWTF